MGADERKLQIYVNSDEKMSRGKYAAQAVHAALLALDAHPDVPVVVLGARRAEVEQLAIVVRDAGRTELAPGTVTAGTDWTAPSTEDFLGLKPSAACEASMHHECDGYFTTAGPSLCTCNCHD